MSDSYRRDPASADRPTQTSIAEGAADGPSARRLRHLARLMDSSIRLPGGFRIGWDGIIGLIPGFGDLAGAGVSAYIVLGAARLGAPKRVIVRMLLNVAIESVVGSIPLLGDLFDMAFKANMRNMRLLDRHVSDPAKTRTQSKLWLFVWAALLVLMFVFVAWLVLTVLTALFSRVFG